MAATYAFIPRDTKVMFEHDGKIREGVVRDVHRPTGNTFSEPSAYTVIYRRGEYTVSADAVLPFDDIEDPFDDIEEG